MLAHRRALPASGRDRPVVGAARSRCRELWAKVRGNQFAKAGVDVAAWVLWSAVHGVPLAKALGGTRTEVVAGVSLGIEPTIDDLLAEVRRQVAAGYPRVKLKIAPGWDVEPVRAVRAGLPGPRPACRCQRHLHRVGRAPDRTAGARRVRADDDRAAVRAAEPARPRPSAAARGDARSAWTRASRRSTTWRRPCRSKRYRC